MRQLYETLHLAQVQVLIMVLLKACTGPVLPPAHPHDSCTGLCVIGELYENIAFCLGTGAVLGAVWGCGGDLVQSIATQWMAVRGFAHKTLQPLRHDYDVAVIVMSSKA
jgi:hypothetical protein